MGHWVDLKSILTAASAAASVAPSAAGAAPAATPAVAAPAAAFAAAGAVAAWNANKETRLEYCRVHTPTRGVGPLGLHYKSCTAFWANSYNN